MKKNNDIANLYLFLPIIFIFDSLAVATPVKYEHDIQIETSILIITKKIVKITEWQ